MCNNTAPIIIHCASGKRAAAAKLALEEQGYTNVLNAGTYSRMAALLATQKNQ
jgi:rhodanese-related sulfurtransferase